MLKTEEYSSSGWAEITEKVMKWSIACRSHQISHPVPLCANGEETNRMLLLLDLQYRAILESPLDDIGISAGALDSLAFSQSGPEVSEVLELDHVPDIAEGGFDYSRFGDES